MAAPVLDIKLNVKASDMEEDSIVKINSYLSHFLLEETERSSDWCLEAI